MSVNVLRLHNNVANIQRHPKTNSAIPGFGTFTDADLLLDLKSALQCVSRTIKGRQETVASIFDDLTSIGDSARVDGSYPVSPQSGMRRFLRNLSKSRIFNNIGSQNRKHPAS